jgi:acetyltransferase-like isoleucine patch superfamily enzyme
MTDRFLPDDWFPQPLPANCQLGERSWLHSAFAFRHFCSRLPQAVRVGRDTGLYPGTFFDLGPAAEIRIGDYCSIVGGIFCTAGRIVIGDYVFISHEVVIADSEACAPPDVLPQGRAAIARQGGLIVMEDDVWIGAQAIILGNVHIGAGAIIGAAAVVDRNVPAYAVFAGNPGRIVGSAPRRELQPRPAED